ncbi:DNA repair protein RAD51 homolog 2 isoform X1 [Pistacia vera]|uniref:DNA repair protein RAD51 homolog 2 isoform X1 n=1 Tax=Pistacia vera TaxID=55513 RepID=UPI0012637A9C|nr:DNA repair protein RAD51 homolog 2 isoform X1 [Pistacia vera]
MANKLINEMGLPRSIANIFAARNITTARDALSLTEFELMELLDVGLSEVRSALAHISQIVSPRYQTALLLMEQRVQKEQSRGHLPTQLKGLDVALCGGIPFGVLTELVGPSGIGKTQFCLKLSLLASLQAHYGGLGGRVIYIDVESKFSSRRLIEIGAKSYPGIFHMKGMAQEMAGRILVLRPTSLSEFTESLQQIKVSLLQNQVKLLVIDSMAALVSGEHEPGPPWQHPLGWHISFIKSLAEFSRIPIVVTNQVRSQSRDGSCQYSFQDFSFAGQGRGKIVEDPPKHDSHLVAALGIHWAHAVTIRLVLESKSGQRFMKVAKSPISPPLAFPFNITSSGISLLNDDGMELMGPEINSIYSQGHDDIINSDGGRLH